MTAQNTIMVETFSARCSFEMQSRMTIATAPVAAAAAAAGSKLCYLLAYSCRCRNMSYPYCGYASSHENETVLTKDIINVARSIRNRKRENKT